MIVPSRSMKTAGDSTSRIFALISKTGYEFISRHSRRSKLAHHYSASVIGNLRRFNRSRAAHESKREKRNRGVPCARDIENLTSLCADVMRRVVLLKKHHPVFAQRDQDVLSFPFLKKRFTDVFKIDVVCLRFVCITAGDSRCKKRFG